MVFYLDSKGEDILDFMAKNGEFIGTLNSSENNISKEDISIQNIEERRNNNEYLTVIIFINTWKEALIFNVDAIMELKTKYKNCQLFWYWINKKFIKDLLPNIKYKEFKKEFNVK